MTNEIVDNTTGLITPARIRDVVESLAAIPESTQTASYTAVFADRGTCVIMNSASAVNFTVPPNSSVAFPIAARIYVFQYGAGQVTVVAGAGVTLRNSSSLTTRIQYSLIGLLKINTDEWLVFGDVT